MIGNLFQLDTIGKNYVEIAESVRNGVPVTAFGLSFSERCLIAAKLKGCLFVLSDELTAQSAAQLIGQLIGQDRVAYVPPREEVLLFKKGGSKQNLGARVASYARIAQDSSLVVTTSITALLQAIPSPENILNGVFTLRKGDNVELSDIARKLAFGGYKRADMVGAEGEFSVRGDILDIYPAGAALPVRLDFFDTEIESIRSFDPMTQLGGEHAESVCIVPATDVFFTEREAKRLSSELQTMTGPLRFEENKRSAQQLLETNRQSPSLSYLFPLAEKRSMLLDYFDTSRPILLDEPKQIESRIDAVYQEHMYRFENLLESGEVYPGSLHQLYKAEEVIARTGEYSLVAFQLITSRNRLFLPKKVLHFSGGGVTKYNQNIAEFETDLKNWRASGYDVLIAGGAATWENIASQLAQHGFNLNRCEDAELRQGITVCGEELDTGFILHERRLAVIGTYDLISRRRRIVRHKNKKDVFVAPSVGDYVVHNVHGIGVCRGIEQLDGQFGLKDFVVVEYSHGDMLYVPVDQMDLLSRYAGNENPKLSKIGGKEFERLKAKVKEGIREMAIDLHKLYLERTERIGFAFSPDTAMQTEFEENFVHTETEDQLKAIAEIKKDMESDKAMDRLLCGDVGYGKTEVAFRAIFKAVTDGKQAAMLTPTTILSQQHYNTALARFDGFGVRIEVLNRFKSDAECRAILEKLKAGEIDFMIGTHRLLSSDVAFKDLGLLVVDEEQRFGVEHKEKIKALKNSLDVLSLSATPIPRTLHMSMVGIRDISVLETPPQERLPIQSYIIEETDAVVADAIAKELARGGQVFVMINRVERIAQVASWISRLVPSAEVVTMHGQMNAQAFENAIYSFYNNEKNVLVCTTIIENGIDLPNANTLIILDSDKLGLAQLYQLRGRVGRSNRLAYCYFTYAAGKVLSEDGYKRLSAIMEFSDFGSGFKIAMRDLEIRGAGDVLGSRQHGHLDKVGYDMYVKLLKECVDELRGRTYEKREATIDAQLPAFIDETYIKSEEERMRVYRRIAETENSGERQALISELNDIYGNVPEGVLSLIDVSLIKKLAESIGAENVVIRKSGSGFYFADNSVLSNKQVIGALSQFSEICLLGVTDKPVITFKTADLSGRKIAQNILKFLQVAAEKDR